MAPNLFKPDLNHVETWVFDLDQTLYPAETAVMSQVQDRMTLYVMQLLDLPRDEAKQVQSTYFREYGTTLSGLMHHHKVDIHEFLDFVHDIDHSVITPDPRLGEHLARLDGKRYVYTNGSRKHAEDVLKALKIEHLFDDLFDIAAANFTPKPERAAFDQFSKHFALAPKATAMFEDSARNLETAAALGFTTILVRSKTDLKDGHTAGPGEHPAHVHYAVDCLPTFLSQLDFSARKAR
ncbi:pyrimidine 5'-nucleotidase [Woodsholea maritima]|uniref:pyrimidine 5'-nucleotidase n=1 Tax=Woodsholea maritima TaxID=240237 RepID=UPI000370459D|nr:pyrimidine 5'-nucleotidase [Woodsholea maritima]